MVRDPEEEAPLLAIDDYRERIFARITALRSTQLTLIDAWGCVLAEAVAAPADLPAFASSAMDGFALRAADVQKASEDHPVALRIVGEVRMGTGTSLLVGVGEAVAVPTGGVVPQGADAVVPIELCAPNDDHVQVLRAVPSGKHIRPAGEDVQAGEVLVPAGRTLRAPDLGALAAAGLDAVTVVPRARVGIVSTGDELVRPPRTLGEGQIYDSNTFTLAGAVRDAGAVPVDAGPVGDDPPHLIEALDRIAGDVDLFLCSGGVSAGERDPVKVAFAQGGEIEFVNVAMQPGRPQAFGLYRDKPLFGLPGNPVSVFVSFVAFVRPALAKMMGRRSDPHEVTAILDTDIEALRTRTRYARVRVRRDGDRYVATPEGGHQSNLLATFARADGLAEVPPAKTLSAGDTCRVILFRDL